MSSHVSDNRIPTVMSIKVTKENYHTYKRVYEIISSHLFGDMKTLISADTSPIAILNKWEASSMSLARKGLQSGLNDCLSTFSHWPKEMLADVNSELERNHLPNVGTLSELIQKTINQVLKTGKIKSIDQYYIVKEVLDDTTSDISADVRSALGKYRRDFEIPTSR